MDNKEATHRADASKQVEELATISVEELFQRLGTSEAGLTEEEAEKRLDQFGPNEVAAEKEHTWLHRLFTATRNPLVILLTVLATFPSPPAILRAGTVMLLMVVLGLVAALCAGNARGQRGGETESDDQRHGHGGARRRGQRKFRSANLSRATS